MRKSAQRSWILLLAMIAATAVMRSADLAADDGNEPVKTDLFEAGKEGDALYRIPGIVGTKQGTVLAYCEARRSDRGDWGPIDVLMRRSIDGGRTWLPRQKIVHVEGNLPINPVAAAQNLDKPGENTVNNPVAIVDHETGAVHFLYCLEYMRCFYMRSDDDGATWTEPVEMTATFEAFRSDYDWKVLATGPAHGIQLTRGKHRGRLVVPVWLSLGTGGHSHRPSVTATIYSDDHGKTWQRGQIAVPDTPEFVYPNETVVVQLADGRVMLNARSESKRHRRIITTSSDGATNWSAPRFDEALLEPICMAGLVRVREPQETQSGLIAFSNPHNLARQDGKDTPGTSRNRVNVSIKLSDDEGQTWSASRTLEEGFSGYSDMAALPDGTILCFYERGSTDGKDIYRTGLLTVARFNEAWVRGKTSVPPNAGAARPLRILPLGDSITRGSYLRLYEDGAYRGKAIGLPHSDGGGYRKPLQDQLRAAGVEFDFVGELNYVAHGKDGVVDSRFDPDHHGLAGFGNAGILSGGTVPTPADVLAKLGADNVVVPGIVAVLEKHQPDVILLMAGANGFDDAARDKLIRTIGEHSAAHLFVATILPQKPPRDGWERVAGYNASLPAIVESQRQAGKKITLVKMHAAVSPDDLLADGVHPDKAGLAKMAGVWFESLVAAGVVTDAGPTHDADVCVYGGTSGGVVAAVQAARMGKRVVLVEPGRHLGGRTSGGLSAVDIGEPRSVGGIAREYFSRLVASYGKALNWDEPFKGNGCPATGGAYSIEPHVAERIFDEMVREAGVVVLRNARLASVKKEGARIGELTTEDGRTIRAKMFLDTTYEGDLMAAAGVSYTLMREGNAKYNEHYNGIHYPDKYKPRTNHLKPGINGRVPGGQGVWDRDFPLDPYVVKGDASSGLLPLINEGEPGTPGEPAAGVMAYCFRLCLSTADDRLPITPPADYDAARFELVARFIEACQAIGDDMDLRWFSKHDPLPNQKWDFNTATFGGNLPGASWEWPEASYDRRDEIAKEIENYHRGLLHFLATDPRVPEKVRQDMQRFGLPKDEFPDTGGWPHQLYIREGRRMVSDLVLTEHHTFGRQVAPHSIGLGSYGTDVHEIRRIVKDGVVTREGKVAGGRGGFGPYQIGYGAIVPKADECENLLVTFALSASHTAFASIRMEPVFMVTSQSAATAACLAIDEEVAVQEVDYEKLKTRLLANGQVL